MSSTSQSTIVGKSRFLSCKYPDSMGTDYKTFTIVIGISYKKNEEMCTNQKRSMLDIVLQGQHMQRLQREWYNYYLAKHTKPSLNIQRQNLVSFDQPVDPSEFFQGSSETVSHGATGSHQFSQLTDHVAPTPISPTVPADFALLTRDIFTDIDFLDLPEFDIGVGDL